MTTGVGSPGFDAGRTGHSPFEDRISPDTVDDLHQIWTAATDGGDVAGPAEEPVVSNQAVHVSAGRALYALSKSTGARLWQKEIGRASCRERVQDKMMEASRGIEDRPVEKNR